MPSLSAEQPAAFSEKLTNAHGFEIEVVNIGASLKGVGVPTRRGLRNVVLAYDDPESYREDPYCLGATIGRYANRIAGARFPLNGRVVRLEANDKGACLHGGSHGLNHAAWTLERQSDTSLMATHSSPDGAGGFPGNLDITLVFKLLEPFTLTLDFKAVSDADTVLSLSNHAYFNLDPEASTIDTHALKLMAEQYTPADESLIPTGEIRPVNGTEFDYRSLTYLADPLTGARRRLDTNFVTPAGSNSPRLIAMLDAPDNEVQLLVHTTQPGFQVYTSDNLGAPFAPRQGLCIEPQSFPDAPNQAGFPSALLKAGATYRQRIIYEFRVAGSES